MSYAHWSVRVVSFLIDVLACAAPNIIAGVVDPDNTGLQVGMGAISLLLLAYDRWYLAGRTGQSWGKRLMGTTLVRPATSVPDGGEPATSVPDGGEPDGDTQVGGQQVGVLRSFLRDLAHLLDTLPCFLGWFWPLWDRRKQTFADKPAATAVLGEAVEEA